MSADAPRRALAMTLRELVDRYRSLATDFGQPVALQSFGLSQPETERLFSSFDEDYHISRYFHFPNDPASPAYTIDGPLGEWSHSRGI